MLGLMDEPKRDRALHRVRVRFAVALAVAATALLLICDASDSAVESLGASRPHDCLHVQPRP